MEARSLVLASVVSQVDPLLRAIIAFLELLLAFLELNTTSDLHRIAVPALVMVGEEDILKPRQYAEIIAREIPNSEFAVIPNAGHALLWEQAGLFNSLILGFLARQRPS